MEKRKSIIGGIILIAVGLFILMGQIIPGFADVFDLSRHWPLIILAIGGLFLLGAFFGTPDLAIPGCVITGLGVIFYYQSLSGNWASWAYVWALLPGFAGIGMYLTGTLDKSRASMRRESKRLIFISAVLFLVFAFFFTFSWNWWPVLLIGLGLWLIIRNRQTRTTSGNKANE